MARIDLKSKSVQAKLVYYGPGLCGKTTNLQYVNQRMAGSKELMSLATAGDRTIFFDFMPLGLGKLRGLDVEFKLYTVPGQVRYGQTRRMVLKNADGVVFVADSQQAMMDANLESLDDLFENLEAIGIHPADIPILLQYNKRDLPNVASVAELDAALNKNGYTTFEASAVTGVGVVETLKTACKQVLENLGHRFPASSKLRRHEAMQSQEETAPEARRPRPYTPTGTERQQGPNPTPSAVLRDRNEPQAKAGAGVPEPGSSTPAEVPAGPTPNAVVPEISPPQPKAQEPRERHTRITAISAKEPPPSPVEVKGVSARSQGSEVAWESWAERLENATARLERVLQELGKLRDPEKTSTTSPADQVLERLTQQLERLLQRDATASGSTTVPELDLLMRRIASLPTREMVAALEHRLEGISERLAANAADAATLRAIEDRIATLPTKEAFLALERRLVDQTPAGGQPLLEALTAAVAELPTKEDLAALQRRVTEAEPAESGSTRALEALSRRVAELPTKEAFARLERRLTELLPTESRAVQGLEALTARVAELPTKEVLAGLEQRVAELSQALRGSRGELEVLLQARFSTTEGRLEELKRAIPVSAAGATHDFLTMLDDRLGSVVAAIRSGAADAADRAVQLETLGKRVADLPSGETLVALERRLAELLAGGQSTRGVLADTIHAPLPPSASAGEEPAPPGGEVAPASEPPASPAEAASASPRQGGEAPASVVSPPPAGSSSPEETERQPPELGAGARGPAGSSPAPQTSSVPVRPSRAVLGLAGLPDSESASPDSAPASRLAAATELVLEEAAPVGSGKQGTSASVASDPVARASSVPEASTPALPSLGDRPEPAAGVSTDAEGRPSPLVPPPAVGSSDSAAAPPEAGPDEPERVNAARIARVMVADLYLYHRQEVEDGIRNDDFFERNEKALSDMRETFVSRTSEAVRAREDFLRNALETFIDKKRKQLGLS